MALMAARLVDLGHQGEQRRRFYDGVWGTELAI